MVKFGKICLFNYLLCLNHTIQLAVLDAVYTKPSKTDPKANQQQEISQSEDLSDSSSDENFDEPESEADHESEEIDLNSSDEESTEVEVVFLPATYSATIDRMRKIVKLFKFSPLANATLQKIIVDGGGKKRQLPLDVRTRWSSLAISGRVFLDYVTFIDLALAHKSIRKRRQKPLVWSAEDTGILKVASVLNLL